MRAFMLFYLAIYGSMNGYLLWRAKGALSLGLKGTTLIGFWIIMMVAAPVAMHLCERAGMEKTARLFAWAGWCWLGFIFLFICASLPLDIFRAAGALLRLVFGPKMAAFVPGSKLAFLTAVSLSLTGNVYGFFEARAIRTERIVIHSSKVPKGIGRFRIVQISDVHFGLILREGLMSSIARVVDQAQPDILVSTGDLVDGASSSLDGLSSRLAALPARDGKFAVTGNHEFYAGIEQSLAFTKKAGFTVLRQEKTAIGGWLTLVGVDDPAGSRFKEGKALPDEKPVLDLAVPSSFIVLLKHQPVVEKGAAGHFDLQLSGHIHGGQIFPFNFVVRLSYPLWCGLTKLPEGGEVYVSRGTGTWGPPVRLFEPPEITIIDLEPAH